MGSREVGSPTVRGRRLKAELRRLRKESGLNLDEIAAKVGCNSSWISRIESSKTTVVPRPPELKVMLQEYGVQPDSAEYVEMLELGRQAKLKGWWLSYSDVANPAVPTLVGLEAEATEIRTYCSELLPSLLQTEGYASALFRASERVWTEDEIDKAVKFRIGRQDILLDKSGPELWVVINEAVLQRPVGGRKVMAEQLLHILDRTRLPSVTVQVLPNDAGGHAGMEGPFRMLSFGPADPAVVYVEAAYEGWFLEKPEQVARYARICDRLLSNSASPEVSAELIEAAAHRFNTTE